MASICPIILAALFFLFGFSAQANPDSALSCQANWEARTALPLARTNASSEVAGDTIFLTGGRIGSTFSNSHMMYIASAGTWTTLANMITGRNDMGLAAINGKIYAIGGATPALSNKNECYDIATNTWSTKSPLPVAMYCDAVTLNGLIYILGGTTGVTQTYFYAYNPVTDSYTQLDSLNVHRLYARLVTLNGKIYAIGGQKYTTAFLVCNDVDVYDPITNEWSSLAPLPQVLVKSACTAANGKIHSMGGSTIAFSYWTALNKHYIYDPLLNSWSADTLLPYPVYSAAAETVNDTIFVSGGTTIPNTTYLTNHYTLQCHTTVTGNPEAEPDQGLSYIYQNAFYPNSSNKYDIYDISVYEITGNCVYTGKIHYGEQLKTANWASGLKLMVWRNTSGESGCIRWVSNNNFTP